MALEKMRQQGRFSANTMRGLASSLPRLYAAAATGSGSDRSRAEDQIASIFRMISMYREMNAQTPELRQHFRGMGDQADAFAEQFSKMSKEEATAAAMRLTEQFSSMGELQGLVGGVQ
jgi:hypothetical protein